MSKFKKVLKVALPILFIAAISFGCYKSTVPIDRPSQNIESSLLGTWYKSKYSTSGEKYVISKKNAREYKIVKWSWDYKTKKHHKPKTQEAYISIVSGQKFINLKDGRYYYPIKMIKKSNNHYEFHPLSRFIKEKFSSSSQLKSFIEKHMQLSFFYDSTVNLYKK